MKTLRTTQFMVWTAVSMALVPLSTMGDTVTFDFDAGPGPNFQSFDSPPSGLWTLDTDGPTLRIAKPSDAGTINPNGFLNAGFRSVFAMDGDYEVTVDFTLHDFPSADGSNKLNESLLRVFPDTGEIFGGYFEVLRFRVGGLDRIESFVEQPGSPIFHPAPAQASSLFTGRYRITRTGSIVEGWFAETGSNVFSSLGSITGLPGPTKIMLFGAQGRNSGTRSTTALDISFDNLIVKADTISGLVPEPSASLLAGIGLGLTGLIRRRSRNIAC